MHVTNLHKHFFAELMGVCSVDKALARFSCDIHSCNMSMKFGISRILCICNQSNEHKCIHPDFVRL